MTCLDMFRRFTYSSSLSQGNLAVRQITC